jgi:class 3 adenylate cyclase/tetratricopeptide (TPR) repeat protein
MGQPCLRCGFENPSDSRFCGGCGARLQEVRAEDSQGERRQLTVLFADLVGSTELSQRLDPEDLGELIAAYQTICGDAVAEHEGHIAQYLGDGVVVYFGYPKAHEDEAQRAVQCGLDILERCRALRENGTVPQDLELQVRLGAHTGRAVVGRVGAGDRQDRLALGDTPNIAARIQSEATPGSLVVSDATWKLVRNYFDGKLLGSRRLKGVSDPIDVWLVENQRGSIDRVEAASMLTPMIGREQEREMLLSAWGRVQDGHSEFILLSGDPGIGKSRLVHFLREEVEVEATDILVMRATPSGHNSPFRPVIDLIEQRLGLDRSRSPGERRARLERSIDVLESVPHDVVYLLAPLLSLPTDDDPPVDVSPARWRVRTIDACVELTAAIASRAPTLLVVEDLHWADSSTQELIEVLVTTAPAVPLLGVLTTRSELRPPWARSRAVRTIELEKFSREGSAAIAKGVAFGKGLPADVLRQIVARSDGVPLFVEELTRTVLDSGLLRERAASWEAIGPLPLDTIPASVDASLTSRIDRLGASRATAQLAATIGREFSLAMLRAVSERSEGTLRQDLDRLLEAGVAFQSDDHDDLFVFKHALIRDAAYNSLLRSTRQQFHARIATALRERFTDQIEQRPDLIAFHLTNAGNDEEAVPFWEAASQQAIERASFPEAAGHLEQALECLARLAVTPTHQGRELEIRIMLAPLLMTVKGWGSVDVEHMCERARALAVELERFDLLYAPLWGLWTVLFLRGELGRAMVLADEVRQMAQASGIPMIALTGHHATAFTRVFRGEFEEGLAEADAGLELYDFEQEKLIANTFQLSSTVALRCSRATSLWMMGRFDEAEREWEQMLQLARDLEHAPSVAAALGFQLHRGAYAHSHHGQMDTLTGTAEELITLSRENGLSLWDGFASTCRGIIALATDEEVDAQAQIDEGWELYHQTGSRVTLGLVTVMRADALYRLDRDDEALRLLDEAQAEMDAREEGLGAPDIPRLRGRLLARRGERDAAELSFRRSIAAAQAQKAWALELRASVDLYDLLSLEGRADEGRQAVASSLEHFTHGSDRVEVARALDITRPS